MLWVVEDVTENFLLAAAAQNCLAHIRVTVSLDYRAITDLGLLLSGHLTKSQRQ